MIAEPIAFDFYEPERKQSKQTLDKAMELSLETLRDYRERYAHWVISYSGGKDSTALLTVIDHFIQTGQLEAPETLNVLYADTRMEIPPLYRSAMSILDVIRSHGHGVHITLPPLDHRFFVYRLGLGVSEPKSYFRWCTPKMKVEPIQRRTEEIAVSLGMGEMVWNERYHKYYYKSFNAEKFLMLTGVREGESAIRDKHLTIACTKDGGECGQARFLLQTPKSIADTAAPLIHWRVCNVWDYLTFRAPRQGYSTDLIAQIYGGEEARENNARTGCIECPLVEEDHMLNNVIAIPEHAYLAPLKRLDTLYAELAKPEMRLSKDGTQRLKDGSYPANPLRMGPLTLEARLYGLEQVLGIQNEINAVAERDGKALISLINEEEEARIRELIAMEKWPVDWTGTEPRADMIDPTSMKTINKHTAQYSLFNQPTEVA